MGNSCDNFQLHRFTTNENIAKKVLGGGATFFTHTVDSPSQHFLCEQVIHVSLTQGVSGENTKTALKVKGQGQMTPS